MQLKKKELDLLYGNTSKTRRWVFGFSPTSLISSTVYTYEIDNTDYRQVTMNRIVSTFFFVARLL